MVAVMVIVSITACADARGSTAGPTTAGPTTTGPTTAGPTTTWPATPRRIALVSFDACGDYLAWVRQAALTRVGPYGLGGLLPNRYADAAGGVATPLLGSEDSSAVVRAAEPPMPATTEPSMPATDTASSADHGTNVQEAGVDEGDQTKVDGTRIVTVHGTTLEVVSIAGAAPTLVSSIDVGLYGGQLLVDGDRAIVYGPSNTMVTPPTPLPSEGVATRPISGGAMVASPGDQQTSLVQVDLSKGAIVDRRTVDGTVTAARSVDGSFRFVVSSVEPQQLGFVTPQNTTGEAGAIAFNKAVIEQSTIDDWLPSVTDASGHRSRLVDCASMSHPATFSGFDTLTVITVPGGLDSMTATGLTGDAQVTYASPSHLYVATTAVTSGDGAASVAAPGTDIHRFDISTKDAATYQGSGHIDGAVLNQYSMSESGEFLRVATTEEAMRPNPTFAVPCCSGGPEPAPPVGTGSSITVLALKGGELTTVGTVGGLGPSEQIKAVRYLGDLAYVVTFRRTDPLHVVDLSVPTAPRLLGELTADGYSSYLQPVGPNRLLGIGTDVGPSNEPAGALATLYDTSDPTHPRELDRITFPFAQFDVANDPHAFTWDEATQVATATGGMFGTSDDRMTGTIQGVAIGISVAGDHLREVGRIVDPAGPGTSLGVSRTLVAGDRLWSITWTGVSGHDRATLAAVTPMLRW
jgi:hypothetical protein